MEDEKNKTFSQYLHLPKDMKKIRIYNAIVEACVEESGKPIMMNHEWIERNGNMCVYGGIEWERKLEIDRRTIEPIINTFIDAGIISRTLDIINLSKPAKGKNIKKSMLMLHMRFPSEQHMLNHIKKHQRSYGNTRRPFNRYAVKDSLAVKEYSQSISNDLLYNNTANKCVDSDSFSQDISNICAGNISEELCSEDCFQHRKNIDIILSVLKINTANQAKTNTANQEGVVDKHVLKQLIGRLMRIYYTQYGYSGSWFLDIETQQWIPVDNSVDSYTQTIAVLQTRLDELQSEATILRKQQQMLSDRAMKKRKPRKPTTRSKPKVVDEFDPMTSIYK